MPREGTTVRQRSVAVVGAGWAGVVAARALHDAGCRVHLFERGAAIGGHSRAAHVNGVLFEPEGPHIFHTSSAEVMGYLEPFGMDRAYVHKGLTEIYLDDADESPRVLSWPPQVDELRELPIWSRIERELARLPAVPSRQDFESYCVSIMGGTLYSLFIEGYTVKQWGRRPAELSYKFAPGRLDLRTDGDRRLFKDRWEFFPLGGAQEVIERVARPVPATLGQEIRCEDLDGMSGEFSAVILTVPLDSFVGRPDELEWRGIRTVSRYIPTDDPHMKATPGYIVNQPSLRRAFTRTVETKHASGQVINGTVVTEEYPGAPERHYPVLTVDSVNERSNARLKTEIQQRTDLSVYFCGRLANYTYINQDVAVAQGLETARTCLAELRQTTASRSAVS